MTSPPASSASPASPRLDSLDAYRGFVMFLMMAEVLRIKKVAAAFPESDVWKQLAFHTSHVEWFGCSLHDMIQPSFSFLVGVAMPFSLVSRKGKGQSFRRMLLHAVWRAVLLTLLGVFLRSSGRQQTNFTFEDTLSQIGLGYVFLFLLAFVRIRWQVLAVVLILVAYWGAFALYPLPPADFDYPKVGVPSDFQYHSTGLGAHFNKNSNLAWAFDTWFLNLFPRQKPFVFNGGGYSTLSFIPTLGTMILGLIAGGWLRLEATKPKKIAWLVLAGLVCGGAGWALDHFGICPIVKKIWTPSWTLYSGGLCYLMLAGFYAVVDGLNAKALFFPLIVIGANSIAAYCMAHWWEQSIADSFRTNLWNFVRVDGTWGGDIFKAAGPEYESLIRGGLVLLVFWLILLWMYRKKIFIRI